MSRKKKRLVVPPPPSQKLQAGSWFKAGLGLVVVLCLAGGNTLIKAFHGAPGEARHIGILTGLIVLGCGTGLLAGLSDWFKSRPEDSVASRRGFYAVAFLVGGGLGFSIFHFGMSQFGGFDHSVVVDVGWRLVQGQKAHIDFPCTLPAGFFLGVKYAFQLFGVAWRSLVLITVIFSLGLFFWSLWLLLQFQPDRWLALFMAVTIQSMSLLLVSYWWYNPITSATAAVFMLAAVFWWQRPECRGAQISYFFALFLMALMKPNIAGIIVPLTTAVFVFSKVHRLRVLLLSAGAFAAFVGFLWLNEVGLSALLKGYLTVAERGATLKNFLQDLSVSERRLSLLALALAILPAMASAFVVRQPWLPLAGMLAGGYGFVTNGELKLVDLPPILVASFILAAGLKRNAPNPSSSSLLELPPRWRRYLAIACVILSFAGMAEALTRQRVKAIGPNAFFEYQLAPLPFPGGFFKDLRSGDILQETYRQIDDLLHQETNSSVMFGPRMQWGYAAFGRPSPRNQPIWWHPGVSFAAADEALYFSRILESHFDVIVLLKNDVAYFSPYFVQTLEQHYQVDQHYTCLTVLRRFKTPPPS